MCKLVSAHDPSPFCYDAVGRVNEENILLLCRRIDYMEPKASSVKTVKRIQSENGTEMEDGAARKVYILTFRTPMCSFRKRINRPLQKYLKYRYLRILRTVLLLLAKYYIKTAFR